MRKLILSFILVAAVLLCAGCGAADVPETTQTPAAAPTAAPTQPHACTSVCGTCNLCTDAACTEAVCAEKCEGTHQEEPCPFPTGDYITTEAVSVDTGTLVFDIGENVYVPGNLAQMGETIAATIEKVTGLDFDGAGYAREIFPDGKVHISVSRDSLYVEQDWYQGLKTSEVGNAYAGAWGHVVVGPGDLFITDGYAVIHELGHMMMFRQSEWSHCRALNEGFAEYTAYLVVQELERTNPELAFRALTLSAVLANMEIWDYEKLFEHPIEYWFENTFEHSGNTDYAVGFRLMAYLHAVYGDYSKWITEFENRHCFKTFSAGSDVSEVQLQIEVLKATYGEDVLDNFYPWLKENLERFVPTTGWKNLAGQHPVALNWYPAFNAIESVAKIQKLQYSDLYLNIESVRKYLREYKQQDVSDLVLVTSEPVQVELYWADGTYSTVMTNSQKAEAPIETMRWDDDQQGYVYVTTDEVLSLEGVSYIKLVGEGKLEMMEIAGDFRVLFK